MRTILPKIFLYSGLERRQGLQASTISHTPQSSHTPPTPSLHHCPPQVLAILSAEDGDGDGDPEADAFFAMRKKKQDREQKQRDEMLLKVRQSDRVHTLQIDFLTQSPRP